MIFNLYKTNIKKNQFVTSHSKMKRMLLAIDIGNTRIKAAVFEENTLLEVLFFSKEALQKKVQSILKTHPKITDLIVASVGEIGREDFLMWEKQVKIHFVSHTTSFPFQNHYATPQTLGIDRMVLATGAVLQFPNQNRLVIDAGTCITYDFVDSNNVYHGGAISPGIRLRYEALHQYTAKLPLLTIESMKQGHNHDTAPHLIGTTTQESIHSGVVNGVVKEIDGFINEYQAVFPNFIIILTGGDTDFLAKRLKNTIFANSNFLLESLNQTYQYKIKND
jgi:type III pantothenate kinase